MKTLFLSARAAALSLLLAAPAWAGPGHDHGEDAPAASPAVPAAPRFAALSELFELVGVLDGRQLTLYLDEAASNAPVEGARLDLTLDAQPLAVEPAGPGLYRAEWPEAARAGVHAIAAVVTDGDRVDMLGAELNLDPQGHPHEPAAGGHPHAAWPPAAWAGLAALGLAGLGGLAWRSLRKGEAA